MMDNNNDLPVELERAILKHDARSFRNELAEGWGASTGGLAVTQRYHERLTEALSVCLLQDNDGRSDVSRLLASLRKVPNETIALSILQNILHSIARQEPLRNTLLALGTAIANELWALKITKDEPDLAERIIKSVMARYSGSERRMEAARRAAFNAGYSTRSWSPEHAVKAGAFLFNAAATALPEVFQLAEISGTQSKWPDFAVTLTDGAEALIDGALDKIITSNPVFWPSTEAPKPWDGLHSGGSHDPRVYAALVRSRHKSTQAAVRHAIKTGAMKPAIDALNALQAVPFRINDKVLEVLDVCLHARGAGETPGFPGKSLPYAKKLTDSAFGRLSKQAMAILGAQREAIRKHNLGLVSDRAMLKLDMTTAQEMAKHGRFYTPMNFDWRGRVYALSSFNFQREDRVRALFEFADGMPIGEDGLRWLMIHTANCGDFKVADTNTGEPVKISKRSLNERATWCSENSTLITNIASEPLVHTEWMQAGEPFLFLAACFELSAAWEKGPSFMTHLPTSFDGSCSGLQHLCAMTRATEGAMVNLTPSPLPQDVYQRVADDTFQAIADDTENAELAKLFLEFDGDRRTGVKRNVMTYSYSSKKFGMSAQQQVDLMDPLSREVLAGKREEHPFVGYEQGSIERPSKAARFFASHVFDAIETRIQKPAQAMHFLQKIAKAMAHEGKPVTWTTPVGLPWINRYHEATVERVKLFLSDVGVKRRVRVSIATGDLKAIDKAKAANGVAPNFVHALDASHLLLTTNASVSEGITSIATVHDSFGCLAPQAAQFNAIIREQFAQMYTDHDVLTEILERAKADLTEANHDKLPILPSYGSLNLTEILHADFAFA